MDNYSWGLTTGQESVKASLVDILGTDSTVTMQNTHVYVTNAKLQFTKDIPHSHLSQSHSQNPTGTRAQVVIAGATAGVVTRFCIAPLDVLKIRLQLHFHSLSEASLRTTPTAAGVTEIVRDILRNEGIRGFWKGNIPAEGLYLGYSAVQFLAYRTTNQALDRLAGERWIPGPVRSFVAGAVAGTAATAATYPLDLLRTRFAAQGADRIYDGLVLGVREIFRTEGPPGFFRGLNAAVGQIVPYMGLLFTTYEGLKPALAEAELPFGSGDAVAAVVASVVSKSAVFPLDTVRKRLQIQGPTRSRYVGGERMPDYENGVVKTALTITRREGWRALYRGYAVGMSKAVPASAITMWTYERAMKAVQRVM
ncbi:mitochondrial carrier [Piedraia hortae CBS 480.64]|uniref:Mitochondrial carrier n=1 Tax=Piedraia hortae CBS 480.64 TaxID=1314780 RepID=A0A6A7BYB0_9PEZI|nr:mitochondrial carrier [Piedraia hortae CBS 480.64]